jgi:hypothetical protein
VPRPGLALLTLALATPVFADRIKVDFEEFFDGDPITTELPGLTFADTVILTTGISLNEFEAPPRSGFNVASDAGGPILVKFDVPVPAVWAFFTYFVPVKMEVFDSADVLLGTATSAFEINAALSGDPGSKPNEKLFVTSDMGIASVRITGSEFGGSFAMDDFTYGDPPSDVPEPGTFLAGAIAALSLLRKR